MGLSAEEIEAILGFTGGRTTLNPDVTQPGVLLEAEEGPILPTSLVDEETGEDHQLANPQQVAAQARRLERMSADLANRNEDLDFLDLTNNTLHLKTYVIELSSDERKAVQRIVVAAFNRHLQDEVRQLAGEWGVDPGAVEGAGEAQA